MAAKPKKKRTKESEVLTDINTGGGSYIGGNVTIKGGDFIGRDKVVVSGGRVVAIGGDSSGSAIISGDGNVVQSAKQGEVDWIINIYKAIDDIGFLDDQDRHDLKLEVTDIKHELEKDDKAEEDFVSRRLRNIKRIAPDILDVIMATFLNPINGLGVVGKKLAQKMKTNSQ